MKSGSWSSYVSAGALGDGGGPDGDEEPAECTAPIPCQLEPFYESGYRGYRLPDGRWIITRGDDATGLPIGEPIGSGATAVEAWAAAIRWEDEEWSRRGLLPGEYAI